MKKIMLIVFEIILVLSLFACDNVYSKLDYQFGDYQVYLQKHGSCEMYVQTLIYEDNQHTYYLGAGGCSAEEYYFIRVDGKYVGITQAIKQEIITIDDVIDSEVPFLITVNKKDE